MEKSVKNAVFKGFPVLMESGPLGSKQYSQTTNEEKNNFLSSYFKVYYLVSKCTGKRVADRSAIDTALTKTKIFSLPATGADATRCVFYVSIFLSVLAARGTLWLGYTKV